MKDDFIKNVEDMIEAKGYKKKYIAEQAGIPLQTFYAMTQGRRKVDVKYVRPIAAALGVTANDLFKPSQPRIGG